MLQKQELTNIGHCIVDWQLNQCRLPTDAAAAVKAASWGKKVQQSKMLSLTDFCLIWPLRTQHAAYISYNNCYAVQQPSRLIINYNSSTLLRLGLTCST